MSVTLDLVPNEPLRERFIQLRDSEGLSLGTVAARCGWCGPDGSPDYSRVRWALGLVDGPFPSQPGRRAQRHVRYETALALAAALDLDPVDVGGL